MGTTLRPPRGTRDWMPEEAWFKRLVEDRIRKVFESYGYGEVITPAFEHLELLVAKAGEEVVNQIYNFKDKAGRDLGLRFELTTPIARIVSSKPELSKPIRFYYIAPVWRYEEPQRARLREFWQAGVELIGVEGVEGDAEVIAILHDSLRSVGLRDFKILVNDRRIVEDILVSAGVTRENLETALRALDKLERMGEDFVIGELCKLGLTEEQARRVVNTLVEGFESFTPSTREGEAGAKRLLELVETLEEGYEIRVDVDLSIVRGLGYYTGVVFEAKSSDAGIGSVAGGGRYDDLVSSLGGPRLPATGMAIGVDRLLEALSAQGELPKYRPAEVVVIPVGTEKRILMAALRAARSLRENGLRVTVEYSRRSLSKTLEKLSRSGVRFVLILGPSELDSELVTIRDMEAWEERKVRTKDMVSLIKARLSQSA